MGLVGARLGAGRLPEPIERPHHVDPYRDVRPPSVACPDAQTLDEIEAMRRLGDRHGEAITDVHTAAAPCCVDVLDRSKDKDNGGARQGPHRE